MSLMRSYEDRCSAKPVLKQMNRRQAGRQAELEDSISDSIGITDLV